VLRPCHVLAHGRRALDGLTRDRHSVLRVLGRHDVRTAGVRNRFRSVVAPQ